jgi:hypothetical protein
VTACQLKTEKTLQNKKQAAKKIERNDYFKSRFKWHLKRRQAFFLAFQLQERISETLDDRNWSCIYPKYSYNDQLDHHGKYSDDPWTYLLATETRDIFCYV